MTNRPVVLVTGLGGLIGGAMRTRLADRYDLRGLGRRPGPPGVPWTTGDIGRPETIAGAFTGVDAVVHLAAVVGNNADFDAYLRLENEAKVELDSDDDGGGDLNSRLTFRPPQSGTYRIIVTTFRANQTGRFVLVVQQKE